MVEMRLRYFAGYKTRTCHYSYTLMKVIADRQDATRPDVSSNVYGLGLECALATPLSGCVVVLSSDLSLKDFPLPNLTEFLNVDLPRTSRKPTPIPRASDVVLPRNQWYYQYDRKPAAPAAEGGGGLGSAETAGSAPVNEPPRGGAGGLVTTDSIVGATSLLAVLVAIDIIWFIHRMARTYSTARMILYGCPVYVACRRLAGYCC